VYYRATSREVKRLDSILRGQIYTLSERTGKFHIGCELFGGRLELNVVQLAGFSVIRVFGRQASFERSIQSAVNKEGVSGLHTHKSKMLHCILGRAD
jgi:hypothetical protein